MAGFGVERRDRVAETDNGDGGVDSGVSSSLTANRSGQATLGDP
jgi:hypothetical protein